jgi:Domain of unknown function (DUF4292)
MIRRISVVLLTALPALMVSACSPKTAGLGMDARAMSPAALMSLVKAGGDKLATMTARGSVSFESPEGSGSAFVQMVMKRPDSLLVRFRGPFGIGGGTLFLSRDRFLFYNAFENRVISGVPDVKSIRSVIPFELTPEEILQAFCGRFLISAPADSVQHYGVDEDLFHITLGCGADTCEYWIDPEVFLVRRMQRLSRGGRVLFEATAEDYITDEGVSVPRRISIQFPLTKRRLAVFYDLVTVNPPDVSFAYSVPSSARRETR